MTVGEIAKVLRSKNAGIGMITVDLVCEDEGAYEVVKATLTRDRIAAAYGVPVDAIADLIHFDVGRAIKIAFLRPRVAGGDGLGETDLYGSGQYAPLLHLEVGQLPLDIRQADVVS
jgi:hypothetical protein